MIKSVVSIESEIKNLQKDIEKLEQTRDNLKKLSEAYPDIFLDNSVLCSSKVNKDFEKVSIKTIGGAVTVSPYCVVDGVKIFSNPKNFELARKVYYSYNFNATNKSEIKVFDLEDLKKRYNVNEDIFSHKKVKMALISFIKKNEGCKIVNLKDNKLLSLLAAYL
jgi:hypothetical protein